MGRIAISGLVLAMASLLVLGTPLALAQTDAPPAGATVQVANTDGMRLHLRGGPSLDQPILARLMPGETLTVTGTARVVGTIRWVPVRSSAGQEGWVAGEYIVMVTPPASTVSTAPAPVSTPTVAPPTPTVTDLRDDGDDGDDDERGQPVEVEAKLKYPELSGRDQEITVWVTRNGEPVPGAIVTLETDDGDEDERFRELDPTDEEGRTVRVFDVRRESGTVELRVEAVAPDGGEGMTVVSYFRR